MHYGVLVSPAANAADAGVFRVTIKNLDRSRREKNSSLEALEYTWIIINGFSVRKGGERKGKRKWLLLGRFAGLYSLFEARRLEFDIKHTERQPENFNNL